jgi:DNA-binding response OmpR family regulator
MTGSSSALTDAVVGAVARVWVSMRTVFDLSVKTVAAPSVVRAHPSGTDTATKPAGGVNGTNAWLSGMSPAGLISGAAMAVLLTVAEPIGAVPLDPHPASTAAVAKVAAATVKVRAVLLIGLTSDMPAAWRSVAVETLRSHRWRPRILLYWSHRLDEPEMEGVVRVLLVEDETRLAETVRRGLAAEGFVVDVEHDGVDGLAAAATGDFDVVVLDIMLPGLSGYQIVRELRTRQVWTPVLMLSAKDGEYDLADAFDIGADDYLTKPFSFVVLVARLRALLRRGAPERPTVLTAGTLSLDPARRQVTRGQTALDLTPREYGVLEFLLRNKGDVVSKSEILRSVWDSNYDGDDNVVEVYIGYLRRKIDVPFGVVTIETVRGAGYRLRSDPA